MSSLLQENLSSVVSSLAYLSLAHLLPAVVDTGGPLLSDVNKHVLANLTEQLGSATPLNYVPSFYLPICFGLLQARNNNLSASVEVLLRSASTGRWLGLLFCLAGSRNEKLFEDTLTRSMELIEKLELDTVEYSVGCYYIATAVSFALCKFGLPLLIDRATSLIERGSSSAFAAKAILTLFTSPETFASEPWIRELNDEKILSIRRGDICSSLAAICGSEKFIFTNFGIAFDQISANFEQITSKIVESLNEKAKNVINNTASGDFYDSLIAKQLLLGTAKINFSTKLQNLDVKLPKNYSYLKENSTLRRLVEVLSDKNVKLYKVFKFFYNFKITYFRLEIIRFIVF